MLELDDILFRKLRDLVYQHSGMHFDERKKYFMARRIEHRIESTGASNVLDYYQMLRYGSSSRELQELTEALTTNETYFFREFPQLRAFADHVLPAVLEKKRRLGDYTIRIWSAGCSTGEEPYTLAIILREVIDDFNLWKIQIIASDITQNALKMARRGLYSERAVKDVPTIYLNKYFQTQGNFYQVLPPILNMVDFRHANLLDQTIASELRGLEFVFCRNVLIYFDDVSARRVVDSFYDALRPGGFVLLGHSESVGRITSAFQLERLGDMLVYMK
jgi:chemotaxis protein methyltransferase CheR